jgi:hypothetical protein
MTSLGWYGRHKAKCEKCGAYLRVIRILSWEYLDYLGKARVKVLYLCPRCSRLSCREMVL